MTNASETITKSIVTDILTSTGKLSYHLRIDKTSKDNFVVLFANPGKDSSLDTWELATTYYSKWKLYNTVFGKNKGLRSKEDNIKILALLDFDIVVGDTARILDKKTNTEHLVQINHYCNGMCECSIWNPQGQKFEGQVNFDLADQDVLLLLVYGKF